MEIMRASIALLLLFTVGCRRDESHNAATTTTPSHAGATTSDQRSEFEQLAIELSAQAACDRLRGQFRALPDNENVDVPAGTIGTVWIRDCLAVVARDRVTFTIAGHAWRRTPRALTMVEFNERSDGRLAATYDSSLREVTIKYEPSLPDTFTVLPMHGTEQTDPKLGEEIVSAIAMGLAAPGGRLMMSNRPLSPREGTTVHIPVCTGIPTFAFGPEPLEESGEQRPPLDLRADVPTMFGPLPATAHEVTVLAIRGKTKLDFVCEQDAITLAKGFVDNRKLGAVKPVFSKEVRGSGAVALPSAKCSLVMLARASSPRRRTTMSWYVPVAELPAVDAAPLHCASPGHDDDDLRRAP
jgi:hypothetical protein